RGLTRHERDDTINRTRGATAAARARGHGPGNDARAVFLTAVSRDTTTVAQDLDSDRRRALESPQAGPARPAFGSEAQPAAETLPVPLPATRGNAAVGSRRAG